MDNINNRLKTLKDRRNIKTVREFAEKCGLSESVVGQYLRGERFPDSRSLYKIARALDVTMEYLLTGDKEALSVSEKIKGFRDDAIDEVRSIFSIMSDAQVRQALEVLKALERTGDSDGGASYPKKISKPYNSG